MNIKEKVIKAISNDNKIISIEELNVLFGIKSDKPIRARQFVGDDIRDPNNININKQTIESLALLYNIDTDITIDEFTSIESLEYSLEVDESDGDSDSIIDTKTIIGRVMDGINLLNSKFSETELFISKLVKKATITRNIFYEKYLDKVDSLFRHYASEAQVKENEINHDPSNVLVNKLPQYINNIVDTVLKSRDDFNDLVTKSTGIYTYSELVKLCQKFITNKDIDISEESSPTEIVKAIRTEFRWRLGRALLSGEEIYGYSMESILKGKFPQPGYVIVSQFVTKPNEPPSDISVDSIFDNSGSFKVIHKQADPIIYKIHKDITNKLKKVSTNDIRNNVDNYKKFVKMYKSKVKTTKLIKSASIKDDGTNSKDTSSIEKSNFNKCKKLLKGELNSYRSYLPTFMYVTGMSLASYKIILKIDELGRSCINAMLDVESSHTDKRDRSAKRRAINGRMHKIIK